MKTLADRVQVWLSGPNEIASAKLFKAYEANFRTMRQRMRVAKRFTLDDAFTRDTTEATMCGPEKSRQRAMLAELPYDVVWVEMPFRVRAKALDLLHRGDSDWQPMGDRKLGQAGFLCWRDTIASWRAMFFHEEEHEGEMVVGASIASIGISPTGALWRFEQMQSDAARDITGYIWGYPPGYGGKNRKAAELMEAYGTALPEPIVFGPTYEKMAMEPDNPRNPEVVSTFINAVKEAAGDARFLVTVLAAINTTPIVIKHVSASGTFKKRLKNHPYLDTNVVTLKTSKTKMIRAFDKAFRQQEAQQRRRHGVRGHWRIAVRKTGIQGCRHMPYERDGKYATCERCRNRIVWLDDFHRGDASIGFATKEYRVER